MASIDPYLRRDASLFEDISLSPLEPRPRKEYLLRGKNNKSKGTHSHV